MTLKNILKEGLIILTIYVVFTAGLLLASERLHRLEQTDNIVLKNNK